MIFIDEMKYLTIYNKQFYLPINEKEKLKGSAVFLLTPNINSSVNLLNSPLFIKKYFNSYNIQKDVTYYINQEGYLVPDNRSEVINEAYSPGKLYHLSESNLDSKILTPRIPNNRMTRDGREDNKTPRVSFAKNIDGSLASIDDNVDKEFYIHEPIDYSSVDYKVPTRKDVPDADISHEVWVLNPVKIKCVGKIKVGKRKESKGSKKGREYNWTHISLDESIKEESIYIGSVSEDADISDLGLRTKDSLTIFNENIDKKSTNYNYVIKKLLYQERFKTSKEVFDIYDQVKTNVKYIRNTYLNYEKYKRRNLFIDLSFYNQAFFKNNEFKLDRGINLYFEFVNRFIKDKRIEENGYTKKTIFIPIMDWDVDSIHVRDYRTCINPISMISRMIQSGKLDILKSKFKGYTFLFMGTSGYFKIDFDVFEKHDMARFNLFIDRLRSKDFIATDPIDDQNKESKKAIISKIIDKIEVSQNIKINNLTGDGGEINKDELVKKIELAASSSNTTDEAIDTLEEDDHIKDIIATLAAEEDNNVKINSARSSRIIKLQDGFLDKKLKGTTVKAMIDKSNKPKEIPSTKLKIDTVNKDWEDLTYVNFEEAYNVDEDILKIINSFSTKTTPVAVRDIKIEDTSTSEDLINTWHVQMEDVSGQRFTLKFDIPKFKDNKFMLLRGNQKTINGQLVLLPISKTDESTVQIVSNYNKIFIRTFGTSKGKSYISADRLIKTLNKEHGLKVILGDNRKICSKYELPIDYIDLATIYSKIESKNYIMMFNQDEIRTKYDVDESQGIPLGYDKANKTVTYYSGAYEGTACSSMIVTMLSIGEPKFKDIYDNTTIANKYTYSKASVLNHEIPLIVIMAYSEGLQTSLKKANIEYEMIEKRPKKSENFDVIKFKDGYLTYRLNYRSSLLMNGLKECNTEDYSIADMNKKSMYVDFLDIFGGRILADGLDNFYDLMIDVKTEEILIDYKLPTDYIEILAYSNDLLADNKYVKHTDMTGRRYRSNEIVAGYAYKALSESYAAYRTQLKRNRKGSTMTMKQSAILDGILLDPTASDVSDLNALNELEVINAVSFKGLVGMNSDRSYGLDKRTYDDSMINVLGMSTGFAGNVGITRQATIDMNIQGKNGYIKTTKNLDEMSTTKSLTATEAMTPFGTTRDDPFRTAMTFIQTSKHSIRVAKASPLLISNGMEEALPYMITNTFAFKSKDAGKVIEKTDDYMIVSYKNGTNDFIDLRSSVKKNSSGGFYITVKLDTNYKLGSTFKKNEILAYDKLSFSDKIGHTKDIGYNLGVLSKIAILNTDEGFEDSAIVSKGLSEALSSDVVLKKEISLPKDTNIYNMVKIGQAISEGDPLLIFQNAFDENDINILLKNLVGDEQEISQLGRVKLKSKVTGFVEDIKIYRTCEKEELSESLLKKVNELEGPINKIKSTMKKNNIDGITSVGASEKLGSTGRLKNVEDGVLIEFYLRYSDTLSVGDKIVYFSALKGIVKDIFPINGEPYSDFRKDEKINTLLSVAAIDGRMTTSILMHTAINKVLIELSRSVKTMLDIPIKFLDDM